MNDQSALLETLTSSEMFRSYVRAFSDATGLPLSLRPVEAWQPPLHGAAKENRFCALMAAKSASCAACLRMQEQIAEAATDSPAILKCQFGLTEAAAPLKLGQQVIGYLVTGQVFLQPPTTGQFEKVQGAMEKHGIKMNTKDAREAYYSTRTISRTQLNAALNLLAVFAEHLAIKSNQLATQRTNAEPMAVVRAKEYIRQNLTEDMTLADVAKAACTSTFYICKLFKKHTGLNITEYISRLRIDRTLQLLANPNLRVSEIAFEVGFQSLTHFNRVFRQIIGDSPTVHRETLALPLAA